jgi:hypothetical protein
MNAPASVVRSRWLLTVSGLVAATLTRSARDGAAASSRQAASGSLTPDGAPTPQDTDDSHPQARDSVAVAS